ncbi:MAG: DUF5665 domain-containing protein [bacterium]
MPKKEGLASETQKTNKLLHDIRAELHLITRKSKKRKFAENLLLGMVRGFGAVIGATIIATLIVILLQSIFSSFTAQNWIVEIISEALESSGTNQF